MFSLRNLSLVPKIVLPVGFVLVIALSGLAWIIQARSSEAVQEIAEKELIALSGQYGNIVKNFIEITLNEGGAVAHILSNEVANKTGMSRNQAIDMLKAVVQHNDLIIGCGMLWEPNAFDNNDGSYAGKPPYEKDGRFSVYASAIGNGPVDVTSVSPDGDYYSEPKRRRTSYVTAPYFFEVNGHNVLMVTGCVPILANGSFFGVTTTDITLESFGKVIADLKVYEHGYGVLLTQDATVVAHKENSYLNKKYLDLVEIKNPRALKAAMAQGQPYMDTRVIDGKEMLCYYQPVSFRGTDQSWYLLINAPMDEVLAGATALSHLTIALCIGVLVIVLLIIMVIARTTAQPLIRLASTAQEISSGKLDTAIDAHSLGGEVGRLASAFKTMVNSLLQSLSEAESMKNDAQKQTAKAKEATSQAQAASIEAQAKTEAMLAAADKLEKVASVVSSASTKLATQIGQSERGSSEQAVRMADTATAMDEMNSTVLEVAKNAGAASDVSGRTRQKADDGAQIVKKAVNAILQVQQQSLALKEDMVNLSDHAQSISRIMGVISDIADQTNLLALNAAIEAARAGEAGRGFAVVADEVRKLAEKTMTSTTDVGNAISSIQESANKSMRQMDEAVQAIAEATGFANQSGEALTEIVNMVDNTADQVRAIATASEQQSSSSEEINRSITEVNTIAAETAQAMAEASRAVSDLTHQVQVLSTLIEDLKHA